MSDDFEELEEKVLANIRSSSVALIRYKEALGECEPVIKKTCIPAVIAACL